MLGLAIYLLLVTGVALWARSYRRSALVWGVLAFVISPVLSAIFLFVSGPAAEDAKTCPMCMEKSVRSAQSCRICGFDFVKGAAPRAPEA